MGICKYCELSTLGPKAICEDCEDLIQEHQKNVEAGICLKCKGSGQNMDGTTCSKCEGYGILKRNKN